jgi:hypothetical protein
MSEPIWVVEDLEEVPRRGYGIGPIDRIIGLALISIMAGIITVSALRALYVSGVREGRRQMMVEVEKERSRIVGALYATPLQEAISRDTDRIVAAVRQQLTRGK